MRAVLLLVLAVLPRAAQSAQELVLHKDGTPLYHRPACAVVRDGRDVLAMTRAQAEGRGLKPHADCDPAQAPPSSPAAGGAAAAEPDAPRTPAAPVAVFANPASKYYHRENCRLLAVDGRKLTLDEAGRRYWPCRTCKPPIRKRPR